MNYSENTCHTTVALTYNESVANKKTAFKLKTLSQLCDLACRESGTKKEKKENNNYGSTMYSSENSDSDSNVQTLVTPCSRETGNTKKNMSYSDTTLCLCLTVTLHVYAVVLSRIKTETQNNVI